MHQEKESVSNYYTLTTYIHSFSSRPLRLGLTASDSRRSRRDDAMNDNVVGAVLSRCVLQEAQKLNGSLTVGHYCTRLVMISPSMLLPFLLSLVFSVDALAVASSPSFRFFTSRT